MTEHPKTVAIILAAGKGSRMKSDLPKVLQPLHGKPLLRYVLDAAEATGGIDEYILIVGHQAEQVKTLCAHDKHIRFAEQTEQHGTGHAVMQAVPYLKHTQGRVLVLCGDTPLLSSQTLRTLIDTQKETGASAIVLTAELEDPSHYGRIIRDGHHQVKAIREFRDCTEEEKQIKEINSGVYCFNIPDLLFALEQITTHNHQHEYYLTDTLEILNRQGKAVKAVKTHHPEETVGVNTLAELHALESQLETVQ